MKVQDFMEAPRREGKSTVRKLSIYRAARRAEAKQIYRLAKRHRRGHN